MGNPNARLLELIRTARSEGWYEDDPKWAQVDALAEQQTTVDDRDVVLAALWETVAPHAGYDEVIDLACKIIRVSSFDQSDHSNDEAVEALIDRAEAYSW